MADPLASVATVLIVDDDPATRKSIAAIVNQFGLATMEAGSGREALRLIGREKFDVVLLDVVMPDVYGIDVLMQIKADPRTESVPVLVMTGLSDRDMRLSVLAAGAEDLLAKPVDALELRARLRNLLRSRSATTGPVPAAVAQTPSPRASQPLLVERPPRRATFAKTDPAIAPSDESAACWRAAQAALGPPMLCELAPRLLYVRPDGQLVPPLAEALYLTDLGADLIGRERIRAAQRQSADGNRQDLRCVVRSIGMCTLRLEPVLARRHGVEAAIGIVVAILPDR